MKNIIIIGAGGVGRETVLLIEQINTVKPEWNLLGFVDDNKSLHGRCFYGYNVIGCVDSLNTYESIYAICSISDSKIKKRIVNNLSSKIEFANLIHPSSIIGKDCIMGKGIIIQAHCIITTNVNLGNHIQINPQCGIGHDSIIKDFCSLYWNVNVSGNVVIGEGCILGTKTTIIQGLTIGSWSVIGSASNVIRDIPSGSTAVGNPARVIKSLQD